MSYNRIRRPIKNNHQKTNLSLIWLGVVFVLSLSYFGTKLWLKTPNEMEVVNTISLSSNLKEITTNLEINSNLVTNPEVVSTDVGVVSEIDWGKLQNEVVSIIGDELDYYSISIYDLKSNTGTNINGDEVFPPASISKLPIVLLALKDIDSGKFSLNDLIYGDTIDTHLSDMIIESDNNSMMIMEEYLGGYNIVNQRTVNELGVSPFSRYPYEATSNNIVKVLTDVYNQKILSKNSYDYFIELMTNTNHEWGDRIVNGVPSGVSVAHKIGQDISDYGGVIWNDAGIVFGLNKDFIIVFLTDGVDQYESSNKISEITTMAYNTLNP